MNTTLKSLTTFLADKKALLVYLFVLLCVTVIFGVVIAVVDFRAVQEQEKSFNSQQKLQTLLVRQAMEDHFISLVAESSIIAGHTLVEYFQGLRSEASMQEFFLNERRVHPEYVWIMFLDLSERVVFEEGENSPLGVEAKKMVQQWVEQYWTQLEIMQVASYPFVAPFYVTNNYQLAGMFYPVRVNGEFRGVLAIEVNLKPLIERYIVPMRSGQYGAAYLLDGLGNVVYDHETQIIGQNVFQGMHAAYPDVIRLDQRLIKEESGVDEYHFTVQRGSDVKRKLIAWNTVPLGEQKLIIALSAPDSEIDNALSDLRLLRGLLTLAMGLIVLIGSALFFYNLQNLLEKNAQVLKNDIAERTAELSASMEALRSNIEVQHSLFNFSPLAIVILDPEGNVQMWNPAAEQLFGWTEHELMGKPLFIVPEDRRGEYEDLIKQVYENKYFTNFETQRIRKDGSLLHVSVSSAALYERDGKLRGRMAIFVDISERKHAEEEVRREEARLLSLLRIAQHTDASVDGLLDYALDEIVSLLHSKAGCVFQYNAETQMLTLNACSKGVESIFNIPNPSSMYQLTDVEPWGEAVRQKKPVVGNHYQAGENQKKRRSQRQPLLFRYLTLPVFSDGHLVAVVGVANKEIDYTEQDVRQLSQMIDSVWKMVERKAVEEKLRQNNERLAALDAISKILPDIYRDYQGTLDAVVKTASELMGDVCVINMLTEDRKTRYPAAIYCSDSEKLAFARKYFVPVDAHAGFVGRVIESGQPLLISNLEVDLDRSITSSAFQAFYEQFGVQSMMVVPLRARAHVLGAMTLTRSQEPPQSYTTDDLLFLQELANRVALAIENSHLFNDNQQQLEHLRSLHLIDTAITSSLDIDKTLGLVVEQIMLQLKVDAVNILLFQPQSQSLKFAVGSGFFKQDMPESNSQLGEGLSGRVAQEKQPVSVLDLSTLPSADTLSQDSNEGFISYYGFPLIARGQLMGVLEIYYRSTFSPNAGWMNTLESLVGQAAIAIDNASLFNELQESNFELTLAYDETIEGWARALDLRDKETEGHSRRVTDFTEKLARALNISGIEYLHIRRGALLHDIGKMGIPDHILLKPGPLSADEWVIMKKHPQYAYDMLSTVDYLRPALDIPYCHHERWDGSGYPRGLKGEEIPLAARIFTVVDVWDALISDRPYRPAWPKADALNYIHIQSGQHFDPRVVTIFIKLIEEGLASG